MLFRISVRVLRSDTNNSGKYRCATVIVYLTDLPSGLGGETRFPIANEPTESALRSAGARAQANGATVLRHGASGEADALLAAAEDAAHGVHVRPARGAACVFWTMDGAGIDACSWHNGARVRAGGGGKWIAQKFKELPADCRSAEPLALPPSLRPPGLDVVEGISCEPQDGIAISVS